MVNFGLRSKEFINKIKGLDLSKNDDINDQLFGNLFMMNYQELVEADTTSSLYGDMSVYTAWFLKILIKTLQSSGRAFDIQVIKKNIQDLIVNEKLVVATNSLPMFLVVQMFFPTETVGKEDNTEITKRIFNFIKTQIAKVKRSFNTFKYPLLHFYQLRNLI